MNRAFVFSAVSAFVAGLVAVAWVAWGYAGGSGHGLALATTALIAAGYVAGGWELRRFHAATHSLQRALAALPAELPQLADWLQQLHPSLRNAVRQRVESERAALPGPALTPYLVGLLVLLGMLGTFLGMVVTLNGAVLALESTTDLATIRAALAAPVKGLGLAFGTSVAGVAASAMLGLVSTLCRRERLRAVQALDGSVAATLRPFSLAHQRQQTLATLQSQAQVMPEVVQQLQAVVLQMASQQRELQQQLLAGQDRFHQEAQSVYQGLAQSVDRSLKDSLAASAREASAALQPVVQATFDGMAEHSTRLQVGLGATVAQQLEGLSSRFDTAVQAVTGGWLAAQQQAETSQQALNEGLQQSLAGFNQGFEAQTTRLLAGVAEQQGALRQDLQTTVATLAQDNAQLHQAVAQGTQQQLQALTSTLQQHMQAVAAQTREQLLGVGTETRQQLLEVSTETRAQLRSLGSETREQLQATSADVRQQLQGVAGEFSGAAHTLADAFSQTAQTLVGEVGRSTQALASEWQASLAAQRADQQQLGTQLHDGLAAVAQDLSARQQALADSSQAQLQTVAQSLQTTAQALGGQWADSLQRQEAGQQALASALQTSVADLARDTARVQQQVADQAEQRLQAAAGAFTDQAQQVAQTFTHHADQAAQAFAGNAQQVAHSFTEAAQAVGAQWQASLAQQQQGQQRLAAELQQTLAVVAERFEAQSVQVLQGLRQALAAMQADLAQGDQQRLATWTAELQTLADQLKAGWLAAGQQQQGQAQQICETLASTAQDIHQQAQAQARDTVAEIARLMQAASEAPRAAAEVMGQLRQQLSDSLVRDTTQLEERGRVMAALNELLATLDHATSAQRSAINELVASSAQALQQAGQQFGGHIEQAATRLEDAAAQVAGGAVDVASLAEAFGAGVQHFSGANQALLDQLQRIEAALAKSTARSDEQLAYYVAQAREIIDLSIGSQKQIVEELQQLGRQATAGAPNALSEAA